MTLFVLVDILSKVIRALVVTRAPLSVRQPSIGYICPSNSVGVTLSLIFARQVHPDNLVTLKLAILRNLPVLGKCQFTPIQSRIPPLILFTFLVFNADKEFEARDAGMWLQDKHQQLVD